MGRVTCYICGKEVTRKKVHQPESIYCGEACRRVKRYWWRRKYPDARAQVGRENVMKRWA